MLSLCAMWLGSIVCEPRSACEVLKQAAYNLIVIVLSVSMVWSMVWGCFAYLVSANMKGWKSIVVFVICYVFVSVVNQLLIEYTNRAECRPTLCGTPAGFRFCSLRL
ncbi:MAG: hypothetical protein ACLRMJ_07515 [Alistipes finegoldii]